jgi:leucyl aminopeptidase
MTFAAKKTARSTPITPIARGGLEGWLKKQDAKTRAWIAGTGFTAATGMFLLVPGPGGKVARVLLGTGADNSLYTYAALPAALPPNPAGYYIDADLVPEKATDAALGWALGSYDFAAYKSSGAKKFAALVWPKQADRAYVEAASGALFLARDLINTPAADLGPAELEAAARGLSKKAKVTIVAGKVLERDYPAVHAVGKGSPRAPRVIDLRWGNPKHPKLTLVGKGVVFDTGGLNMKTGGFMDLMKKDMGGSAFALALAKMIMELNLPVNLRVLVPAAENAVDGNSFRPRDVIRTRKGITVEVGDTDAEGRLVLCDALAEACSEKPDLLMDFATLTGAARAALGPDLPALFGNDDAVTARLMAISHAAEDPLWIMPLWKPYADMLASKVADINNVGGSSAGAITAALFLEKFVTPGTPWVHIDFSGWNFSSRPGRPEGGEARGLRACFALLREKFGA